MNKALICLTSTLKIAFSSYISLYQYLNSCNENTHLCINKILDSNIKSRAPYYISTLTTVTGKAYTNEAQKIGYTVESAEKEPTLQL